MFYSHPLHYIADAAGYYAALSDLPWAIWLDSGGLGRHDIIVAQPVSTLLTYGANTHIQTADSARISTNAPLDLLREQLGQDISTMQDIPFCGGAVGYWGYDLARRWMPSPPRNTPELPDMSIGIYDWAVLIDHQEREARLVSRLCSPQTANILPDILARLNRPLVAQTDDFCVRDAIRSNLSRHEYEAAFAQVHEYLTQGDCYQVNLAQRFSAPASGDAFAAYMKLRAITPSPYSAFLNFPHAQILCASPERFLCVRDRQVETKPIKGTRRRGTDLAHDEKLIEDLRNNIKDRAENLMIVDLLRNDLSKVCEIGSVKVERLFEIESYANVHHLVSTISGRLAANRDALALLQACFPGGSITGAPKKRAMEIIEQLEPHPRGIYCGSIGYIGWDGQMDTNIAIRTLVYAAGNMHFSVGGGIVADSTASGEYQETLDKAAGILKMLALYHPAAMN